MCWSGMNNILQRGKGGGVHRSRLPCTRPPDPLRDAPPLDHPSRSFCVPDHRDASGEGADSFNCSENKNIFDKKGFAAVAAELSKARLAYCSSTKTVPPSSPESALLHRADC